MSSALVQSMGSLALAVALCAAGCASEDGIVGSQPGGGGSAGSGGGGGGPSDDLDGDGVSDGEDNCPTIGNPSQADTDGDGEGDACELQDGTPEHPFIIPGDPLLPDYWDARDTNEAQSDAFDSYPGYEQLDESGPEYVYIMAVAQVTVVGAMLERPEPEGTDIDIHLLSSLEPVSLIDRANDTLEVTIDPGLYYFTLDTYVSGGAEQLGPYELSVALEVWHEGSVADPLLPGEHPSEPLSLPFVYRDERDTHDATSDTFDSYPGVEQIDESGPEFVYQFVIDQPARLSATIEFTEPDGTDIDLHLLSSLTPLELVDRGNTALYAVLEPGTYTLVADTYVSGGVPQLGPYELALSIRSRQPPQAADFNDFILAAVDYLWARYRLLGYDSAVLTHDVPYGSYGFIPATGGAKTMCVAAAMEVILTAMTIWAEDRGDQTVFDFLPKESWETLVASHIKAHIWVNHTLDSYGTADALAHFGMGTNVPFEDLEPGAFINLNRTTGTGHAVIFLAFIDWVGREHATWSTDVIGFKYFSSQGGLSEGSGGFDFRYAIFEEHGAPEMPGKRDLHVIYSENPHLLNTGSMWAPDHWAQMDYAPPPGAAPSFFDALTFDGVTAD